MRTFATSLAKKSGNILLKNFRKDHRLLRMRGVSKEIVTKYDKTVDKFIVKAITKKFPTYSILTEESGCRNKNSEFTWIVDSLDGSGNFAVGNPFFSVSLALVHLGKPILGVTYAPFLKELFIAEEGKGALLNGRPVCVSNIGQFRKCYLVSCEGGEKNNIRISKINAKFHPKVKDFRKLGSGALESGWVSCGRAEAYIATKISPWDIAAGVLLVTEAGGKVTDFRGKPWRPVNSDMVFSNGKVHGKILKILNTES